MQNKFKKLTNTKKTYIKNIFLGERGFPGEVQMTNDFLMPLRDTMKSKRNFNTYDT